MKKKDRNINWAYISTLTDVILEGSLGVLWMANMFVQLNAIGFTMTAWIYVVMSALLSASWFVLAYHKWELLKTIPKKTIEENEDEG